MLLLQLLQLFAFVFLCFVLILESVDFGNQLVKGLKTLQLGGKLFGTAVEFILTLFFMDSYDLIELSSEWTADTDHCNELFLLFGIDQASDRLNLPFLAKEVVNQRNDILCALLLHPLDPGLQILGKLKLNLVALLCFCNLCLKLLQSGNLGLSLLTVLLQFF